MCGLVGVGTGNGEQQDGIYNKLASGTSIITRALSHVGYSLNSLKGVMQGII